MVAEHPASMYPVLAKHLASIAIYWLITHWHGMTYHAQQCRTPPWLRCKFLCIHTHACIHTYSDAVYMDVYIYIYIYTCVYVQTYIYIVLAPKTDPSKCIETGYPETTGCLTSGSHAVLITGHRVIHIPGTRARLPVCSPVANLAASSKS
jgi:hypothetical protein